MWKAGGEKLHCSRKPLRGRELCSRCEADSTPYGKMRGAIPARVMKLFREKALTPTRKSTQWYARHLRWAQALYSDIKRNENKGHTHVTEKNIKDYNKSGKATRQNNYYNAKCKQQQQTIDSTRTHNSNMQTPNDQQQNAKRTTTTNNKQQERQHNFWGFWGGRCSPFSVRKLSFLAPFNVQAPRWGES